MPSTIDAYILRVADLDRSVTFWERAMGAELISRIEDETSSNVVLRSPIDGGAVQLTQIHRDERPIQIGHSILRQYIITSDSSSLFDHVTALGYDRTHEPFNVPDRVNIVKSYTRQPDGYLMDLCEYQGELRHGMVDPKQHVDGTEIASYIGQIAIYVTALDPAIEFWRSLDVALLDRVVFEGYMELALLRGDGGVLVQLMQITGQRHRSAKTEAVMPQVGPVDLGTGFLGFRVVTDDCPQLHEQVRRAGFHIEHEPTVDDLGSTTTVVDPDGYRVEIRQSDN